MDYDYFFKNMLSLKKLNITKSITYIYVKKLVKKLSVRKNKVSFIIVLNKLNNRKIIIINMNSKKQQL